MVPNSLQQLNQFCRYLYLNQIKVADHLLQAHPQIGKKKYVRYHENEDIPFLCQNIQATR